MHNNQGRIKGRAKRSYSSGPQADKGHDLSSCLFFFLVKNISFPIWLDGCLTISARIYGGGGPEVLEPESNNDPILVTEWSEKSFEFIIMVFFFYEYFFDQKTLSYHFIYVSFLN